MASEGFLKFGFLATSMSRNNLYQPRPMSNYKQISCGVPQGSVKYLGIIIDSNLNWKSRVNYISTKIKRNISILSKIGHCVNLKTLKNLYNSLIYLFLIYGITAWGNTYKSTLASISFYKKSFTNHYFF